MGKKKRKQKLAAIATAERQTGSISEKEVRSKNGIDARKGVNVSLSKETKKSKKIKKAKEAKKVKKALRAERSKNRQTGNYLIPLAVVLLITALAFIPSLNNDFVNWDDDVNLLNNVNLKVLDMESIKGIFTDDVIGNYNPLPILTFAFERALFEFNPLPYHINNLLLHLLCTFLVFKIMRLLKLSPMAAAIGALLFGIHPMRVESVAWVTERKDVIYGAFYLAAIFNYIKYVEFDKKKRYYLILTMVFGVVSLFGKIQAVALPLSLLCIDYYLNRPLKVKLLLEKVPFFLFSLAFGLLGIYMLSGNNSLDDTTGFSFFERLLVGAYSYLVYLVKLVWPYEMAAMYPYPKTLGTAFYLAPAGVLAIAAALFYAWKKNYKAIVFGFAFFTVNVMFVLQILSAGQGFLADRFTYIPYIGFFFVAAWGYDKMVNRIPQRATLISAGMGLYFLAFFVLTWQQNGTWKNGDTLWTQVISVTEDTAMPYGKRAAYHREQGDLAKALRDYNAAIKIEPNRASTLNSRGKLYFDGNEFDKAIADYNKAIKNDPELAEAYANRGASFASSGQNDRALSDFNKCIELDPQYKNGYANRTLLYMQSEQYAAAIHDYDAYIKLDRHNPNMFFERGVAKYETAKYAQAVSDFDKAIKLDPKQGTYYYQKGRASLAMGNKAAAQQAAQKAKQYRVQLDQEFLDAIR